jgi:acyl-CoA synthetase (AMP-forming)/AMP-acid ligase II
MPPLPTVPHPPTSSPTPRTLHPNLHPPQITDRSKDVIKSGGEWISSVEIENAAVCHPAVAGAQLLAPQRWASSC